MRRGTGRAVLLLAAIFCQAATALKEEGDVCSMTSTNQQGICKIDNECPLAAEMFRRNRVRPTICGFAASSTPIVCCPSEVVPPSAAAGGNQGSRPRTTPQTGNMRPSSSSRSSGSSSSNARSLGLQSGKRTSQRKCEEYSAAVRQVSMGLGLSTDGVAGTAVGSKCLYTEPLIVGGEDSTRGEFPHMAAIGWPTKTGGYHWACGGSLISPDSVLTAAHCAGSAGHASVDPNQKPTVVRLGEHNLAIDGDGEEQDISIVQIIRHPQYKALTKYHDIAVLKLRFPAEFGNLVRPCCLWQEPTLQKEIVVATGWGVVGFTSDKTSDVLQKVAINLIDQDVCKGIFGTGSRHLREGIVDSMLCAGELEGGKDPCQGDSGGPLQQTKNDSKCIFYLVGVTSFGAGCAHKNRAGVYTRVSSYLDWIESVVWPEEATAAE